MEGGNEASVASGITQFAEGEPNNMQNARKKLTRRRGEAEEVREVFKQTQSVQLEPRSGSILIAVGFNPRNKEHAKKNIVKQPFPLAPSAGKRKRN